MNMVERFESYVARIKEFDWDFMELPENTAYFKAQSEYIQLQYDAIIHRYLMPVYHLYNPRHTDISDWERRVRLEEIRHNVKIMAVEALITPVTTE